MMLHFLIPDPHAFVSGGNRYNAALIQALQEAEEHVSYTAYDPNVYPGSTDTTYILDSIYFDQIDDVSNLPTFCVGLIHHLTSLFPPSQEHFELGERAILDHFAGLVVSSAFTRDYLVARGYSPEKIVIIEPVAPTASPSRPATSKMHALLLANLIPRKGVLPFLRTLSAAKCPPYYTLQIVGSHDADPSYAQKCRNVVHDDPLLQKTVRLLGRQDDDAVEKMFASSNLFVSTSQMETFGMAIQEAAVRHIPLLVHAGGHAAAHVQEGTNGWVASDMQALVGQFCGLVASPEKLSRMQESALEFQPRYETSWADAARDLVAFVKNIMDRG